MYYVFASLVVGAFIGGSALVSNQPAHLNNSSLSHTPDGYSQAVTQEASPIVDNQALSAEAVGLSF